MMIGRDLAHLSTEARAGDCEASCSRLGPVLEGPPARRLVPIGSGEIVGLGGLDGQGQRELLLGLFGVLRDVRGDQDRRAAVAHRQPGRRAGRRLWLALVPEDRKSEGLMLSMSVRENLTLAALGACRAPAPSTAAAEDRGRRGSPRSAIKASSLDSPVGSLSGGNQQKVVLAKWLITKPRIILLNDPMRGIDVGTKQELYRADAHACRRGRPLLFYRTDHDELIGMCDRVVLYQGRVVRELTGEAMTEANMMAARSNIGDRSRIGRRAGPWGGPTERRRTIGAGRRSPSCLGAAQPRPPAAFCLFVILFLVFLSLHPRGFSSLVFDGRQSGRGARLRRDGADLARTDRRARSFDRCNTRAQQLRRLECRQRLACGGRAGRPPGARDRRRLWPAERGDRGLWPHPTDYRHARDGRRLHRHCLSLPTDPGRGDR